MYQTHTTQSIHLLMPVAMLPSMHSMDHGRQRITPFLENAVIPYTNAVYNATTGGVGTVTSADYEGWYNLTAGGAVPAGVILCSLDADGNMSMTANGWIKTGDPTCGAGGPNGPTASKWKVADTANVFDSNVLTQAASSDKGIAFIIICKLIELGYIRI